MSPDLAQRVRERLGDEIVSVVPLNRRSGRDATSWHAIGASGKHYAAKRALNRRLQTRGGKDALETEWAVTTLLWEMGAAVPKPLAVDHEARLLVTEWIDGQTLDDLCQQDPTLVRPHLAAAFGALGHIERAIDARGAEVEPYVFELDYDAYLGDDFEQYAETAWGGFAQLTRVSGAREAECRAAWQEAIALIRRCEPTLGSLDYNARNVLFRDGDPSYVDFSTVGWDWPERRAIQYFTALGAYREDGNFVPALTREDVAASREALFFDPDALEAHFVVFLCLAAGRLFRIGADAGDDARREDDLGWANRRRRFETVVALLGDEGLTELAPTDRIREEVRRRRAR